MGRQIIISLGTQKNKKAKNSKRIGASLAATLHEEIIHLEPQNDPATLQKLKRIENNSMMHLISPSAKNLNAYRDLIINNSQLTPGSTITVVLWQSNGGKNGNNSSAAKLTKLLVQRGINATVISCVDSMDRFHKNIKENVEDDGSLQFVEGGDTYIRIFQGNQHGLSKARVNHSIYFTPQGMSSVTLKKQQLIQAAPTQPVGNPTRTPIPVRRQRPLPFAPLEEHLSRKKITVPKYKPQEHIAPAVFHFVWVGGAIPANYLRSLQKIAEVAKRSGFSVNLWVDSPLNYHKTSVAEEINIPNLKLRDIDELIEQMQQEPLYNENNNFAHFLSYVNREMVGYKNLAAVSDLIRYEVLRQYGGYYFDTDLEFLLDENSRFIPDELPLGIKLRTDLSLDLDEVIQARATGRADTNNDLIIATPNHPLLCRMIEQCLDVYQSLDNQHALEAPATLTKMDMKRFPYSKASELPEKYQENRFNLTLTCGPGLILQDVPDFVNALALPATEENYKKVNSILLGLNPQVANVVINFHSDLSWSIKRFDVVVVNDPQHRLTLEHLKKLSKQHNDNPILFRQANQFYLYGRAGKAWQVTAIKNSQGVMEQIKWPQPPQMVAPMKPSQLPNVLYNIIAGSKAHIPKRPRLPAFEAESVVSRFRLFGSKTRSEPTPPAPPGIKPPGS